MTTTVDSYRYLDPATTRIVKSWCKREPQHDIPWTPLTKPLRECRVAFLSSAAIATHDQPPFDQERERRDPWWGDSSYRVLPADITEDDVGFHHLHVDPRPARKDLDVVLPLRRLRELVAAGEVGAVASRHYSMMGFILRPAELVEETAPAVAAEMVEDEVDLAIMVPV